MVGVFGFVYLLVWLTAGLCVLDLQWCCSFNSQGAASSAVRMMYMQRVCMTCDDPSLASGRIWHSLSSCRCHSVALISIIFSVQCVNFTSTCWHVMFLQEFRYKHGHLWSASLTYTFQCRGFGLVWRIIGWLPAFVCAFQLPNNPVHAS